MQVYLRQEKTITHANEMTLALIWMRVFFSLSLSPFSSSGDEILNDHMKNETTNDNAASVLVQFVCVRPLEKHD